MNLRGFYSFGDLYLDGVRDVAQVNRETFNIEQIDVLKVPLECYLGAAAAAPSIKLASKLD